jgi:hypothetical protein
MDTCLLAIAHPLLIFYAIPLIISVSLVYAATRHEDPREIFLHSLRVGLWIVGFMVAIQVVLSLISLWL